MDLIAIYNLETKEASFYTNKDMSDIVETSSDLYAIKQNVSMGNYYLMINGISANIITELELTQIFNSNDVEGIVSHFKALSKNNSVDIVKYTVNT